MTERHSGILTLNRDRNARGSAFGPGLGDGSFERLEIASVVVAPDGFILIDAIDGVSDANNIADRSIIAVPAIGKISYQLVWEREKDTRSRSQNLR